MVDIWCSIAVKSTIYFADKMALKGSLVQTLQEARPTIFFGVPRVYEKIMEGMRAKAKDIKGLKKKVSQECKKAGLEFHLHGRKSVMYRYIMSLFNYIYTILWLYLTGMVPDLI